MCRIKQTNKTFIAEWLDWQRALEPKERSTIPFESTSDGVTSLSFPFLRHPLYLRLGTSDINVFGQIFMQSAYLFPTSINIQPLVIVDVGSNIGISAIFFANCFPAARILAIEIEGSNVDLLKRNVAGYPQIEVWHAGLWSDETCLAIENIDSEKYAFRAREARERENSIRGITMEQIVRYLGGAQIGLLKIDIEGGEKQVFSRGHETWLHSVDALLIELHDRIVPGCAAVVYRALINYSFNRYHLNDADLIVFDHSTVST